MFNQYWAQARGGVRGDPALLIHDQADAVVEPVNIEEQLERDSAISQRTLGRIAAIGWKRCG